MPWLPGSEDTAHDMETELLTVHDRDDPKSHVPVPSSRHPVLQFASLHRVFLGIAVIFAIFMLLDLTTFHLGFTWEGHISIIATVLSIVAMVQNTPPHKVLVLATTTLLALKIISVQDALSGMANPGVVAVAILFVVAAGIAQARGVDGLLRVVLGQPRFLWLGQLRMMLPVTILSAFLNNTPVVAIMIDIVMKWSKKIGRSPSKFMIPLSFASIFGGTCTKIGSSTNLIAISLAQDADPTFELGFFELAYVGLPVTVVGYLYIMLVSPWLLPDRVPVAALDGNDESDNGTALTAMGASKSAEGSGDEPQWRRYNSDFVVQPGCILIGQTVNECGFSRLESLIMNYVQRETGVVTFEDPSDLAEFRFAEGDIVSLGATTSIVAELREIQGFVPAPSQISKLGRRRRHRCLIEVVIDRYSPLVDKTLRECRFRQEYNAVVLAIRQTHPDATPSNDIGDAHLMAGDALLLEAYPNFIDTYGSSAQFSLVHRLDDSRPPRYGKNMDRFRVYFSLLVLVAMVGCSAGKVMPLVTASLIASILLIATKCLTVDDGLKSIKGLVLLTIVAAFGVGAAIDNSGAANILAKGLVKLASPTGDIGLLAAIYIMTMLLASFVSPNAAVVLMYPVAANVAEQYQISARPFVVTMILAAALTFSTPISYQTNLMVWAPGGYTFTDYVKFGMPLQAILFAVVVGLSYVFFVL